MATYTRPPTASSGFCVGAACREVAQPGRAPSSGGGGRRFESSLPDHYAFLRQLPCVSASPASTSVSPPSPSERCQRKRIQRGCRMCRYRDPPAAKLREQTQPQNSDGPGQRAPNSHGHEKRQRDKARQDSRAIDPARRLRHGQRLPPPDTAQKAEDQRRIGKACRQRDPAPLPAIQHENDCQHLRQQPGISEQQCVRGTPPVRGVGWSCSCLCLIVAARASRASPIASPSPPIVQARDRGSQRQAVTPCRFRSSGRRRRRVRPWRRRKTCRSGREAKPQRSCC